MKMVLNKEKLLSDLVQLYDYCEDSTTRDEGDYHDVCGQITGIKTAIEWDED